MAERGESRITDAMLAQAAAAGEKELELPRAKAVTYDSARARLIMELVSGAVYGS